jgi:hypothetical protein
MSLYCFQRFCKASDGAFNARKLVQIDEGLRKICVLQVKGVMGMCVGNYHSFVFWSLKFLDITLLSFHFKKVWKDSNNASIAF